MFTVHVLVVSGGKECPRLSVLLIGVMVSIAGEGVRVNKIVAQACYMIREGQGGLSMQVLPVGQLFPVQPAANSVQGDAGEGSFSKVLNNAINKLNNTQVAADNLAVEFLTGDIQDIHQVTIAMQEAKLSMQLAVEVRNKVIEAYQEISRMQV